MKIEDTRYQEKTHSRIAEENREINFSLITFIPVFLTSLIMYVVVGRASGLVTFILFFAIQGLIFAWKDL